ncbi:MAG: sigma 54-interacting transcriptional regulator [Desulfobacterales bacterium]|nr:sigma 54-interacting transcriptional regulator [Desulfobacterales bacterium]
MLDKLEKKDWLDENLKYILDDISSGIILCGSDYRVKYINKFYAHLLATTPEEATGKDIRSFFPDSRVPDVFESGEPELRQHCLHKKEIIRSSTDITLLVNRLPIRQGGRVTDVVIETIFKDNFQIKKYVEQNNLLKKKVLKYQNNLGSALSPTYSMASILGKSKRIEEAKHQLKKFATSLDSLLITGETGSGKELFAHAAHLESSRAYGPFVCVNCAAIPKDLIESELFGYEKGAFTGAKDSGKTGKIELASEGTLFLDEIGDLSLGAQAKLLRCLESKTIERIGGYTPKKVDFRLICATNADLDSMMKHRQFREDLYYRINSMNLHVPALRERPEDIMILAEHFIHPNFHIAPDAKKLLSSYDWPGNVRELKNALAWACHMSEDGRVEAKYLPNKIRRASFVRSLRHSSNNKLAAKVAEFERMIISDTLESTAGNKLEAARRLGISRSTLYDKCKAFGLLE